MGMPAWQGLRRTQVIYKVTTMMESLPIPPECPPFLKVLPPEESSSMQTDKQQDCLAVMASVQVSKQASVYDLSVRWGQLWLVQGAATFIYRFKREAYGHGPCSSIRKEGLSCVDKVLPGDGGKTFWTCPQ